MVNDIVSGLRSGWPTVLFMLGVALLFTSLVWSRDFERFICYMGLSILCMFGGMAGLSLEFAVMLGATLALMGCLFAAFCLKEWWYHKRFPVFDTEPIGSFTDGDGCRRDLYIAETESGFIIGMMYEVEIDDARSQLRTRWKDRFKTWRDAEEELRCRAASYGLTEETPLRDDRQPPVRGLAR